MREGWVNPNNDFQSALEKNGYFDRDETFSIL